MLSKAIAIIWHSVLMVLNNLGTAALISLPLGLFAILVYALAVLLFAMIAANTAIAVPLGIIGILVLIVFVSFVFSIIAIKWHRFVLLGELDKNIFTSWQKLNYVGYTIGVFKIFMILFLLSIPFLGIFLMGSPNPMAVGQFAQNGNNFSFFYIALILYNIALSYLFFRMAVALPSIAIGSDISSIKQSWDATKKFNGVIFICAVLLGLLNLGLSLLQFPMQFSGAFFVVVIIISFVLQWFFAMVGISFLTTLYGHFIEEREL